MRYIKNDYAEIGEGFYKGKFDIPIGTKNYAKSAKSRDALLQMLKNEIIKSDEFSDEYKEAIKNNKNVSYRYVYISEYSVSADLYRDEYDEYITGYLADAWGYFPDRRTRYVGRFKAKSIKKDHATLEYSLLQPKCDGYSIDGREDYDFLMGTYHLNTAFENMIEDEKELWLTKIGETWNETRNQLFESWHIPYLILKCDYHNESIYSWINANTLKFYVGGYYNSKMIFKQIYDEAQKGDAEDKYYLGYEYWRGKYTEKNVKEAIKWLTISADQKNVKASTLIGALYSGHDNEGIATNKDLAFKYSKFSANKDDALACMNLGRYYRYGVGCEINYFDAIDCYLKAIKLGENCQDELDELENKLDDKNAIYYLGENYSKLRKYDKAFNCYEKCAKLGSSNANFRLYECYYGGNGVKKDRKLAEEYYQKSLEMNSSLAKAHEKKDKLSNAEFWASQKDKCHSEEAVKAYLEAASYYSIKPKILNLLAAHYETGIYVDRNVDIALDYYLRTSISKKEIKYYVKQNYLRAYLILGKYYINKRKIKKGIKIIYQGAILGNLACQEELNKCIYHYDNKSIKNLAIKCLTNVATIGYAYPKDRIIKLYGQDFKKLQKFCKLLIGKKDIPNVEQNFIDIPIRKIKFIKNTKKETDIPFHAV